MLTGCRALCHVLPTLPSCSFTCIMGPGRPSDLSEVSERPRPGPLWRTGNETSSQGPPHSDRPVSFFTWQSYIMLVGLRTLTGWVTFNTQHATSALGKEETWPGFPWRPLPALTPRPHLRAMVWVSWCDMFPSLLHPGTWGPPLLACSAAPPLGGRWCCPHTHTETCCGFECWPSIDFEEKHAVSGKFAICGFAI